MKCIQNWVKHAEELYSLTIAGRTIDCSADCHIATRRAAWLSIVYLKPNYPLQCLTLISICLNCRFYRRFRLNCRLLFHIVPQCRLGVSISVLNIHGNRNAWWIRPITIFSSIVLKPLLCKKKNKTKKKQKKLKILLCKKHFCQHRHS